MIKYLRRLSFLCLFTYLGYCVYLFGCAVHSNYFEAKYQDPTFTEITTTFVDIYNEINILPAPGVDMIFGYVRSGALAVCQQNVILKGIKFNKIIIVSKTAWDEYSPVDRFTILYHELGHCMLERHHVDLDYNPLTQCPGSIMHKSIMPTECMIQHHKYYIKELFGLVDPVTVLPNNYEAK